MRFCHRSVHTLAARNAGFSLTELLVVIVILGLLAGLVAANSQSILGASKVATAKMEISKISDALDQYNGLKSGYPSTAEGLDVLLESTKEMPGGFLKRTKLEDPWGQPYEYTNNGNLEQPFEVVSSGADGKLGTDDDISNLDL